MRVRMLSAASVLVLLFLPSESCSPLHWPGWEPRLGAGAAVGAGGPAGCGGARRAPPHPAGPPAPTAAPLCAARAPRAPRTLPRGRRREGRPNSLDLTFHLLREFLDMSREERLAQKALSNKLLLQSIGK